MQNKPTDLSQKSKTPYVRPELTVYGDLSTLTQRGHEGVDSKQQSRGT